MATSVQQAYLGAKLAILPLPLGSVVAPPDGHLIVAAFRIAAAHNACAADTYRLTQLLEGLDTAGVVLPLRGLLGVVDWVHQICSFDIPIACISSVAGVTQEPSHRVAGHVIAERAGSALRRRLRTRPEISQSPM